MTEPTTTTPPSGDPPTVPLDPSTLSHDERISHILDIRRRVQQDASSVSDDEIRLAVQLIRMNRAEPTRRKTTKTKEPVKKVSLSDF